MAPLPSAPYPRPMRASLPVLALALAATCSPAQDPTPRLDLLLVSLDTTRADHLSAYGYGLPTSPALEALAAESHRFAAAYTVMGLTLPAHAALFTSLYPSELGLPGNGFPVPSQAQTLAERLADAGYATRAFVSAGTLHRRLGIDQGFDAWDGPEDAPQRDGAETVERALAWLGAAHADAPRFTFVHLFDAHTWYEPPAACAELFDAPAGVHPPERGFVSDRALLDAAARRAARAAYDAELRHADNQLARLLAALDASGRAQRTLVVVVADPGEILDERFDAEGYAFDHGEYLTPAELHVPLLLRLPAAHPHAGAAIHAQPVGLIDVTPTLLELLGLPAEEPLSGRSLVPLIEGAPLPRRVVVSQRRELGKVERALLGEAAWSVVDGAWLGVQRDSEPLRVYDLARDPEAARDVAAEEPERATRMVAALDAWRAKHGAALWPEAAAGAQRDPDLDATLDALGYSSGDEDEDAD